MECPIVPKLAEPGPRYARNPMKTTLSLERRLRTSTSDGERRRVGQEGTSKRWRTRVEVGQGDGGAGLPAGACTRKMGARWDATRVEAWGKVWRASGKDGRRNGGRRGVWEVWEGTDVC